MSKAVSLKIKTHQLAPVGLLADGIIGGQKTLREDLQEHEFPFRLYHRIEKEDCVVIYEYEVRLSKLKTLSLHQVGMNVKQKKVQIDE